MHAFFKLAAVSPTRQRAFRSLALAHLLFLTLGIAVAECWTWPSTPVLIGNLLLVAGIVEGALLIGWRLTQLPKSQALEFVLVSQLRPPSVLLAEALVGLSRLALITFAGLPLLMLLVLREVILLADLPVLVLMPLAWGAVTGLGLTAWAYEPWIVRRWGERVIAGLVVLYLVVGILAAENLKDWLRILPLDVGRNLLVLFAGFHQFNPFGTMKYAMEVEPAQSWPRVLMLVVGGVVLGGILLLRAMFRLHGHFQERHYRPAVDDTGRARGMIGDWPLSWWAVRRVSEYSGRINLWLAGGFGILYAAYLLAGPHWPAWLGRGVFQVFDRMGGVPVLTAALVLLGAVPAAFQYGLWDSHAADRCRRLELLLLTGLHGWDYWEAALAAAWKRGRGYLAVAVVLWLAGLGAAQFTPAQAFMGLCAGVIVWGLYFALGFRAFAAGTQASRWGLFLTVGLPVGTYLLYKAGWPTLAALLPPGSIYQASTASSALAALPGPVLLAIAALWIARWSLRHAEGQLRRWFHLHHGRTTLD
jgi:hypothetical protein